MLKAIRLHFARQAYGAAAVAFADYQRQPANGIWNIRVAVALLDRKERAEARFAAALHA